MTKRTAWVKGNDFRTTHSSLRDELDGLRQNITEVSEPIPSRTGKLPGTIIKNKQYVEVYFELADTDVRVPHKLGVAVKAYEVLGSDKPCQFYDGEKRPTANALYLRSTVNDVNARFFVIAPGGGDG